MAKRKSTVLATPSTPPVTPNSALAEHTSDVKLYKTVTIHTAKCSVCEVRNGDDKMRRCPYCTWQICGKCRGGRGDNLRHGSMNTWMPPSNRRKLATPGGGVQLSAFPGVQPALSMKKEEPPKALQNSFTKKLKEAAQDAQPTPSTSPFDQEPHFAAQHSTPSRLDPRKLTPLATAQEPTTPISAKKHHMPGKPLQFDDNESEFSEPPEDEDDAFLTESPTDESPLRKRQKTATRGRNTMAEMTGSPVKRTRRTGLKNTVAPEKDASNLPSSTGMSAHDEQQNTLYQNREAVSEYYGIDPNAYQEHPLQRHEPVANRTVRIPARVRGWGSPRKSAEEIQRDIQMQVGQKMVQRYGWPPLPHTALANDSPGAIHAPQTIEDAVTMQLQEFRDGVVLTDEQMRVIDKHMKKAASIVCEEACKQMAPLFRESVEPGLGMKLGMLTKQQQTTLQEVLDQAGKRALEAVSAGNLVEDTSTMTLAERRH